MIYDGDIIIVLEGLENFRDPDTNLESSLKFWLPKTFPERVRVIVTASPNSKSARYMRGLGCPVVPIMAEKKIMRNWIDKLREEDHKNLLVSSAHSKKLADVLEEKVTDENVKMIFVKAMIGLLCPKADQNVQDFQEERELIGRIFSHLKWNQLDRRLS